MNGSSWISVHNALNESWKKGSLFSSSLKETCQNLCSSNRSSTSALNRNCLKLALEFAQQSASSLTYYISSLVLWCSPILVQPALAGFSSSSHFKCKQLLWSVFSFILTLFSLLTKWAIHSQYFMYNLHRGDSQICISESSTRSLKVEHDWNRTHIS